MTAQQTDLSLSRILKAPRANVWRAWSDPEKFVRWWAPAPVTTTLKKFVLRPGGAFHTIMKMPDGAEMDGGEGCFLEVVPEKRIAFTDALSGGWRPNEETFFSAIVTMEDHPDGTLYSAVARHKNDGDRQKHADMGFLDGWGQAIGQLETVAQELKGGAA